MCPISYSQDHNLLVPCAGQESSWEPPQLSPAAEDTRYAALPCHLQAGKLTALLQKHLRCYQERRTAAQMQPNDQVSLQRDSAATATSITLSTAKPWVLHKEEKRGYVVPETGKMWMSPVSCTLEKNSCYIFQAERAITCWKRSEVLVGKEWSAFKKALWKSWLQFSIIFKIWQKFSPWREGETLLMSCSQQRGEEKGWSCVFTPERPRPLLLWRQHFCPALLGTLPSQQLMSTIYFITHRNFFNITETIWSNF